MGARGLLWMEKMEASWEQPSARSSKSPNYSDISQSTCAFERRTPWRQRSGCERVLLGCDSRDVWVLKSSVPVIHSRQTHWRKDGWQLMTDDFEVQILDDFNAGQMLCSPRMPVLQLLHLQLLTGCVDCEAPKHLHYMLKSSRLRRVDFQ